MTILEQANKELQDLRPNLAPGDLKRCAKEIGITAENVSLYMNRKGGNPQRAIEILTFLKNIISDRKKQLA